MSKDKPTIHDGKGEGAGQKVGKAMTRPTINNHRFIRTEIIIPINDVAQKMDGRKPKIERVSRCSDTEFKVVVVYE